MTDQPFSQYISGRAEYQTALDAVIARARSTVRIFDYDLHDGGYDTRARYDGLSRFLRADVQNQLLIVLHSVDYVTRDCPRLLMLLQEHSYAVLIHQTNSEARSLYDPMLVADDAHYVHRFHYEQPRAEWVMHHPGMTEPLLRHFEAIWQASTLAVPATTLGL